MSTERIELSDTFESACIKLAEGNPGALRVIADLAKYSTTVDPQCFWGELGPLISLDTHGIYGSRIWMLYTDVCGGGGSDVAANIVTSIKMLAVIRACQLGLLSVDKLNHAIDNRGDGIDVDAILDAVKGRLVGFCVPCSAE